MNASCQTYECVMSHMWMSHVTHMNESCHAYEWIVLYNHTYECVMSHVCMRHITRVNISCLPASCHTYAGSPVCHTFESDTSRIQMTHVERMNGSRHTYEWAMPHTWKCRDTHMNESFHTYEWVVSHIWMNHNLAVHERSIPKIVLAGSEVLVLAGRESIFTEITEYKFITLL